MHGTGSKLAGATRGYVRSADCKDSSPLSIKIMDLAAVAKLVGAEPRPA